MPCFRRILTIAGCAALLLAACDDKTKPTPIPTRAPPTIPAVITQIVTPLPTVTPAPTPTVSYDLLSAVGSWIVRYDLSITDTGLTTEFTYSGAVELQVNIDGGVSGAGSFSQNIASPPCDARVIDGQALTFTVQGTTYPVGDQVAIDLTIQPDTPDRHEHYALICPDNQDIRQIDQAILWPALMALPEQTFKGGSMAGLQWRLVLQAGQTATLSAPFSAGTDGALQGTLTGDLWLQRG